MGLSSLGSSWRFKVKRGARVCTFQRRLNARKRLRVKLDSSIVSVMVAKWSKKELLGLRARVEQVAQRCHFDASKVLQNG